MYGLTIKKFAMKLTHHLPDYKPGQVVYIKDRCLQGVIHKVLPNGLISVDFGNWRMNFPKSAVQLPRWGMQIFPLLVLHDDHVIGHIRCLCGGSFFVDYLDDYWKRGVKAMCVDCGRIVNTESKHVK